MLFSRGMVGAIFSTGLALGGVGVCNPRSRCPQEIDAIVDMLRADYKGAMECIEQIEDPDVQNLIWFKAALKVDTCRYGSRIRGEALQERFWMIGPRPWMIANQTEYACGMDPHYGFAYYKLWIETEPTGAALPETVDSWNMMPCHDGSSTEMQDSRVSIQRLDGEMVLTVEQGPSSERLLRCMQRAFPAEGLEEGVRYTVHLDILEYLPFATE